MSIELKEAAQQALNAMDEATTYTGSPSWSPSMTDECIAAASALRAALAPQPDNASCKSVQKRLEAQQLATATACGIPGMAKTTCPYCEQGFAFEHEQSVTGEPVGVNQLRKELSDANDFIQSLADLCVKYETLLGYRKTKAPEGASELAEARGESNVNTELDLAMPDSICDHVFVLDPKSSIRICNKCGTVEGKKHPRPAPSVFLVRDVASLLGASVPDVCNALAELGYEPRRSTNAAISPDEAIAVAKRINPAPSVPDDVVRDAERYRWLKDRNNKAQTGVGCWESDDHFTWLCDLDADAAIDAAMLAAKDSK